MAGDHLADTFVPVRFVLLATHTFAIFVLATATENSINVSIYPGNDPAANKRRFEEAAAV